MHFFGGWALGILAAAAWPQRCWNEDSQSATGRDAPSWTDVVIGSVFIVSGIQLLAIGLLGELQVRTTTPPAAHAVYD